MINKNLNTVFESKALKQAVSKAVEGSSYQLKGLTTFGNPASNSPNNKKVISIKK